ncbi:MAG: hypothetical protein SLAVMIC_00404 [uncultured marine phage]|uniref:Uncharacterized protein n=1 Tax=uncultured marine phage TaxID=707152 RepID=A0A8D9FQ70_9VIRU|nr:MAG: hypothetical protein SLAVMIC_00404 [uncultured marine phage]
MTRCYPVKSIKANLHGDCSAKVVGIHVEVLISWEQFREITPKKDLIVCEYVKVGKANKFRATRIIKNKVNL